MRWRGNRRGPDCMRRGASADRVRARWRGCRCGARRPHSFPSVYDFTRDGVDVEDLRKRLARMDDQLLVRYGKAAAYMRKSSPREEWKVTWEECRMEWRRRYPKKKT